MSGSVYQRRYKSHAIAKCQQQKGIFVSCTVETVSNAVTYKQRTIQNNTYLCATRGRDCILALVLRLAVTSDVMNAPVTHTHIMNVEIRWRYGYVKNKCKVSMCTFVVCIYQVNILQSEQALV